MQKRASGSLACRTRRTPASMPQDVSRQDHGLDGLRFHSASWTVFETGAFFNRVASSSSRRARSAPRAVELFNQIQRTAAQPAAHLVEVGGGRFAHRAIEFQILDRPQRQRLLTLQRRTLAAAGHFRCAPPPG